MNTKKINQSEEIPMTYGISRLDTELDQYLNRGNLHLVGGFSGGGKTVLACQLTVKNTSQGKKVLYLSTEVDYEDYFIRCVSNGVRVPYDESMEFEMPDGHRRMLKLDGYEREECLRSVNVIQDLNHRAEFCEIDVSQEEDMATAIIEKIHNSQLEPDLVVLDYLTVSRRSMDSHHIREEMINVMEQLRALSRSMNINIVVFAQLNPDFKSRAVVPVHATSECKTLHEYADVPMAMSWLCVPELEEAIAAGYSSNESYLREQYLNVQSQHVKTVIPVKTHYHRMTLDNGDHEVDKRNRDHISVERDRNKACKVLDAGGMNNYVWLGRSVYERVCNIAYPPAVNVYVFHLLVANRNRVSHHSFIGMADKLGLSVEQIRTAIDKLKSAGLLQGVGKKRDMKKLVVKLDENSAKGDSKGGVKLNQNMTRLDFTALKCPSGFRVWLWLLINAESNFDSGRHLQGEVVVIPDRLAEMLKMSPEDVVEAIQAFKRDGRLFFTYGDLSHSSLRVRLRNWAVYQYEIPRELAGGYVRRKKLTTGPG